MKTALLTARLSVGVVGLVGLFSRRSLEVIITHIHMWNSLVLII